MAFKFGLRLVLAALLLFMILFTFSEPVRAGVLDWIKHIAGFEVHESETISGFGGEDAITVPADAHSTLEDVIENPPFEFAMPAYVPDGYIFTDKVDVYRKDKAIFTRWVNKDGEEILLLVEVDQGQGYLTGVDAAEEIEINGQPAMLVYGGYDQNGKWDSGLKMVNIYLRRDNLIYLLSWTTSQTNTINQDVLTDELIRMAGSIPKVKN